MQMAIFMNANLKISHYTTDPKGFNVWIALQHHYVTQPLMQDDVHTVIILEQFNNQFCTHWDILNCYIFKRLFYPKQYFKNGWKSNEHYAIKLIYGTQYQYITLSKTSVMLPHMNGPLKQVPALQSGSSSSFFSFSSNECSITDF